MLLCDLPSGTITPAYSVKVRLEDGRTYDNVSKIIIKHSRGDVCTLVLTSEEHDMSRNLSSHEEIEIIQQ